MAAVRDAALFELVESAADKLLEREPELLARVLLRAATLKAEVTSADERESGLRAVLNWGHTLGHAIEALLAPRMLHGECVAVGMVFEAKLALTTGHLPSSGFIGRLVRCLQAYALPTQLPKGLTADALLEKLQVCTCCRVVYMCIRILQVICVPFSQTHFASVYARGYKYVTYMCSVLG